MAATVMCGFLDRLRAAVGPEDDSRPDAQLLVAFSDRQEALAFVVLVHRYGPLVWSICRRLTGDCHTAEDAFQATFLVLARKAGSIRPRHSVGGWLHRTATNIALKVRAMNHRRKLHESPRDDSHEPITPEPPEPTDPAALAALEEEIAQLPDGLRTAVVLCELQGISRRQAAIRLGTAEGTVSSRLAAARKRLAERLRRRGIGPACGIGGLLAISSYAVAKVPSAVAVATAAIATGEALPVKASVSFLVNGEIRAMLLTKLTSVATGVIALFALAVGPWLSASPVVAGNLSPHNAIAEKVTVPSHSTWFQPSLSLDPMTTLVRSPLPQREGVIVVTSMHGKQPPALICTPDGTEVSQVTVGAAANTIPSANPASSICPLWLPRLSPDAKRLAAIRLKLVQNGGPFTPNQLWVFDLDSKEGPSEPLMVDMRCPSVIWSTDGTKLYGSHLDPEKVMAPREDDKPLPVVSWVYDLKTKKKTMMALPVGHGIADITPDGKTLLTVVENPFDPSTNRSYLVSLDTLKPELLTKTAFKGMRFSPDGKWVLGNRFGKKEEKPLRPELVTVSVADGSERKIALPDEVAWIYHACWSPDGKRIAYHWHEEIPQPAGEKYPDGVDNYKWHASRLNIADTDGRNTKTIIRREYNQEIQGLDWK